jgi:hypothetical protein
MLRPFIVTYWSGRTLDDMPDDVWEVYQSAGFRQRHVNVALLALDSNGKLLRSLQPLIRPGELRGDPTAQGRDFERQLDDMLNGLKLPRVARSATPKLTLPDVCVGDAPTGVRIFLKFSTNRLNHYRTPTVEAVAMTDALRTSLRHPAEPRSLAAADLRPWLEQIYPPAIMDGQGGMRRLDGKLTLRSAGSDAGFRYAVLDGDVTFELDNRARTSYLGQLAVILKYAADSDDLVTVRGVCDCTFKKPDAAGRPVESIRMTAAIESRPE